MKTPWGRLVLLSVALVGSALVAVSCKTGGVAAWAGDYSYEEEPVKALAGYSMVMDWAMTVGTDGKAVIELNGQQTAFKILADVEGDSNKIQVVFDKGLEGTGYENLKKGDRLFQLTWEKGKIITAWEKLTPRLAEKFKNNIVCFVKGK